MAVSVIVMLRHRGRVPGLAAGPTRRIVGTTIAALPLLALSPTKFTHHLGIFAAAVMAVLAMSFASSNSWWYVASYGIPWWNKPISISGIELGTVVMVVAVVLIAVAGWIHIRDEVREQSRSPQRSVPMLAIAAAVVVVVELASFIKAAVELYPGYSIAKSNLSALAGNPCGLANDVLAEPDANAGTLTPLAGDAASALGADTARGFSPDGVNASDLASDGSPAASASVGTSLGSSGTTTKTSMDTSTDAGGASRVGINGSSVALPFGLDPSTTPILGTYGSPGAEKRLVSGWYKLTPGAWPDHRDRRCRTYRLDRPRRVAGSRAVGPDRVRGHRQRVLGAVAGNDHPLRCQCVATGLAQPAGAACRPAQRCRCGAHRRFSEQHRPQAVDCADPASGASYADPQHCCRYIGTSPDGLAGWIAVGEPIPAAQALVNLVLACWTNTVFVCGACLTRPPKSCAGSWKHRSESAGTVCANRPPDQPEPALVQRRRADAVRRHRNS
ncbi:arabinosyltransferase C-terminal domain-containing protein [Nocardia tengchongensis]